MLPRLPDFPTMSLDRIRREYEQDPMLPAVEYAMAHNNLGVISLSRLDWNAAEPHFREVIRVWPNNYLGYFNMGRVAAFQFKTNAAMEWWQAALRRKPDDVDTLCLLGGAHAAAGDYTNALAYYDGALRTSPNHPVALSRLAWMLATCPDPGVRNGPRAVRLAEVLPALSGAVSAHACDVLAAALAEAGRFDEAIACAGKALDLLGRPESGRPAEVSRRQEIAERLELYRRRQPYRDTP